MNYLRAICSILITLCWSMLVLLYVVSHKQLVTHVVKSKVITAGCNSSVGQEKEHQMCLLHFYTNPYHLIRIVRNTDSNTLLSTTAYWKTATLETGLADALVLYSRQADTNKFTADRIIRFRQIRI